MLMNKEYIQVEDYNISGDMDFLQNAFIPYLKDIFDDLLIRCHNPKLKERLLDKATFLDYCNLPGIIGERFFNSISSDENAGSLTEIQFVNAFVLLFNSQLDNRLKLTFEMYDFNNDGLIVKDDVRIILSYIPFKRNQKLNINNKKLSPIQTRTSRHLSDTTQIIVEEGLYKQDEGKDLNYHDRKSEQKEILDFLNKVFEGISTLSFQEYKTFNYEISSEMFLSIMGVFHERIPCASNFFRLKKIFQIRKSGVDSHCRSSSLSKTIASPTMFKNIQVITNSPIVFGNKNNSPLVLNNKQIKFAKRQQSQISNQEVISDLDIDKYSSNLANRTKITVEGLYKEGMQSIDSEVVQGDQPRINLSSIKNQSENSNDSIRFMQRRAQRGKSQYSNNTLSPKTPTQQITAFLEAKISKNNSPCNYELPISPTSPQVKSTFSKQVIRHFSRYSPVGSDIKCQHSTGESSNQLDENTNENYVFSNYRENSEKEDIYHSGDVYFQTKTGKYKRYKGIIMKSEFYCYSSKDQSRHKLMHSLKGSFIKKMPMVRDEIKERDLYPLKFIIPPTKYRVFYFLTELEQQEWYDKFKTSMGQTNIEDYYTMDKVVGKGSFGTVCIGYHLKSGQKVAIKTIKKQDMKPKEILQQRKEIEVLKVCKHPNIVQLFDVFEDYKAFYIVMEFMKGGDLFDYLKSRRRVLPESKSKVIVQKIVQALKQLHSYGIIHRDLKLENIMMSDDTDQAFPKIADFGLAKVLGPCQTSSEPYGTRGYTAPEVLSAQPYSFSCDIWSLGCITTVLLTGTLPFKESQELIFDKPVWKQVSKHAIDLIAKILEKDPVKRLTLEQVLDHEWIKSQK